MRIISCDPGKAGALSLIVDGRPIKFWNMPIDGKCKLINLQGLADIIRSSEAEVAVVEQVHSSPTAGVSSSFNFGANYYGLQGVATGMGLPCFTIQPQKWKTFHGLIGKPKDASRLKVIAMFPELKEVLKYKKDVDIADAILLGLAWYKLYGRGM